MELYERIGWFFLGLAIGAILGYIVARLRVIDDHLSEIKEEVDEIDDIVKHQKDEAGVTRLRPVILDVILFGVVIMVAYAAWSSGQTSNKVEKKTRSDKIALCKSGQEGRDTDRRLVEAVFNLATTSIERPVGSPPLTETEVGLYNAYIDRINRFRKDMYDQIQPSQVCEPFVSDADVKPATEPYPHIK